MNQLEQTEDEDNEILPVKIKVNVKSQAVKEKIKGV